MKDAKKLITAGLIGGGYDCMPYFPKELCLRKSTFFWTKKNLTARWISFYMKTKLN
jgi:hypothetical protein